MLTPEEARLAQEAITRVTLGSRLRAQSPEALANANAAVQNAARRAERGDDVEITILDARGKRLHMGLRRSGDVDLIIGDVPGTGREDDTQCILFSQGQLETILQLIEATHDTLFETERLRNEKAT
jgi:hypothetical protein